MSQSLRSMPYFVRELAITRRLKDNTKGLGYWAAKDSENAKKKAEQKSQAIIGENK